MGEQGPRGAPPKQDLEPAYSKLMEKLYLAFEQYSDEGDAGRKGVSAACLAVVQFIAVRHENPELAVPFLAVRQLLMDFDNHVDPELLSRTGAKERSRSGVRAHLRRWASVCLEVLVEKGEPLEIAAGYVARHVDAWPGVESQNVTGNTIQNWREREHGRLGPERAVFDALRADLLGLDNPKGEVDRILREGAPGIPASPKS
jgi:hypothetical protein